MTYLDISLFGVIALLVIAVTIIGVAAIFALLTCHRVASAQTRLLDDVKAELLKATADLASARLAITQIADSFQTHKDNTA